MAELIHQNILRALKTAEELYHRLVLLVGPSGSGKTAVLQNLCTDLNSEIINVNSELSGRLLDMTDRQRTLHLHKLFEQIVSPGGNTVVLDNLELLFDAALKQDPLRLLQHISRNRNVVAAWNGCVNDGKLMYAEPGHPEYREYNAKELLIVSLNSPPGPLS